MKKNVTHNFCYAAQNQKPRPEKQEMNYNQPSSYNPVSALDDLENLLSSNLQEIRQSVRNGQTRPQVVPPSNPGINQIPRVEPKQNQRPQPKPASRPKPKQATRQIKRFSLRKNYESEKAVENGLVIPLIKHLGYSQQEYEAQYRILAGNRHKNIEQSHLRPDFVLLPKKVKRREKAFAVIEAKRSIKSQKDFDDALDQGIDYARLLESQYIVVASQEKVWLFERDGDDEREIYEASWKELNNDLAFNKLTKYIGRQAAA